MQFDSLGLSPALLRALAEQGYTQATPVQQAAIPLMLAGHDVLAGAQTGTGKTAAFTLPILQRLFADTPPQGRGARKIRALILTPTRELAAQVQQNIVSYSKHMDVRSTTIFGGVGMGPQVDTLRRGVDILVATPGRLIDHLERGTANLSSVETLVLDEGDRMLDMGFLPAIRKLIAKVPRQRQTALFSATFSEPIKALASQFLNKPEYVQVAKANAVATNVSHRVHPVDHERKREALLHLLNSDGRQTLVFSRTKHGADRLCKHLDKAGLRSAAIHGNKSQNQRTRALREFKNGKIDILVATDIAARGLDIDQLPIVINHDLPNVPEDYVHRIGRTGRAGASGLAISLVSADEVGLLQDIRRVLKQDIEVSDIEGFEPLKPLDMDARPTSKPNNRRSAPAPRRSRGRGPAQQDSGKPHAAANRKPRRRGQPGGSRTA